MTDRRRKVLSFYVWFQTVSLLTENLQRGVGDLIFNIVNLLFLVVFFCLIVGMNYRLTGWLPVLAALLVIQLFLPATLNLILFGNSLLLEGAVKISAWLVVLLFTLCTHVTTAHMIRTIRTLQQCGVVILLSVIVFTLTKYGESPYDLGLVYLGTIQSSPALSMTALAFLAAFLAGTGSWKKSAAITGLFIMILLLMKRSAILVAAGLMIASLPRLITNKILLRTTQIALILGGVSVLASKFNYDTLINDSGIVSERLQDFGKVEERQDYRYLGSGRIGLLEDHWQVYTERSAIEQLCGALINNHVPSSSGKYLGTELDVSAHNDFMEVLTRAGLLGLLGYLGLLACVGKRLAWGIRPALPPFEKEVVFAGVCAFVIYLLHTFVGVILKVQFMILVAILAGLAIRTLQPVLSGANSRRSRS